MKHLLTNIWSDSGHDVTTSSFLVVEPFFFLSIINYSQSILLTMRSAIFESDSKALSKSPMRTRPPTASPNLMMGRLKKRGKSASPYVNEKDFTKLLTWNLEEMIQAYQESGSLPPILSPTLPESADKSSNETIKPLSLESKKKMSRVRWINKLDEPRPRFLLRITVSPQKSKTKLKVTGLGISLSEKPAERDHVAGKKEDTTPPTAITTTTLASNASTGAIYNQFIKLARETQFMANNTEGLLSMVIECDSIMCYLAAYNHHSSLEKKWLTLHENVQKLVLKVASLNYDQHADLLKFYRGLLFYLDALILRRLISKSEETSGVQDSKDPQNLSQSQLLRLVEHQRSIIENYKAVDRCLDNAQSVCPNFNRFIESTLPQTWKKKTASKGDNMKTPLLIPIQSNAFKLPFSSRMPLNSFTSFMFHAVNESIDVINAKEKNRLIYTLKSGANEA